MTNIREVIQTIHQDLTLEYPFLTEWEVTFDNAKRRAGICRLSEKVISISRGHIAENSMEVVSDTILHEFSHAIAYELYSDVGHGKAWKNVAIKLGAVPRARGKFAVPKAPWILVHNCPKTLTLQAVSERYRRNKNIKNFYLTGKPETKGELYFVKADMFVQFKQGLLDRSRLPLVQ